MPGVHTIDVKTRTREEMVDVTPLVRGAIRASGVSNGIACVFCPHTTAAITVQENTDRSVKADIMNHLREVVPRDAGFQHSEDNSDAHIKGSVIGASLTFIVDGGRIVLGHWQGIYLCEFDGPRQRRIKVKVIRDHL